MAGTIECGTDRSDLAMMVAAIRHVARLHGAEDKYHEMLTRAWLHVGDEHVGSVRWVVESTPEPTLAEQEQTPLRED